MTERTMLLYGANGFTGRLIAARAREYDLAPVLAGRSRSAIEPLAQELRLPSRVFDLADPGAVDAALAGVQLVLHAAGPYSQTSRPMVDGCLRAGAHYLDITGEYHVLEAVLGRAAEAKAKGVVLLPAVGFDVVPTDCMAARLAAALPGAASLELAFSGGMRPSPGTAKTTVENLHVGQKVRRGGELVSIGAPLTRTVPFGKGPRFCMSIPWGDLVTAFHSTGIRDVTVFTEAPRAAARLAPMLGVFAPILRMPSVVGFMQRQAEKRAKGPSDADRGSVRMWIWGRVAAIDGRAVEGHLEVPEGYELTVLASLEAAKRVLSGEVPPGATTPSRAFGPEFVTELPGVGQFRLDPPPG